MFTLQTSIEVDAFGPNQLNSTCRIDKIRVVRCRDYGRPSTRNVEPKPAVGNEGVQ